MSKKIEPVKGKCQGCGKEDETVVRRRQSTAYAKDEMNWATLCPECHEINDEYWKDMWNDYYRGWRSI